MRKFTLALAVLSLAGAGAAFAPLADAEPSGCVAYDPGPALPNLEPTVPTGSITPQSCSFVATNLGGGYVGAAQSWSVSIAAPAPCPAGATPPCYGPAVVTNGTGPVHALGAIPPGASVVVSVTNGAIAAGNVTGTPYV